MSLLRNMHDTNDSSAARRGNRLAWFVVMLAVAAMLALSLTTLFTIGDRPRTWQFRSAPFIPAQTYSSTQPASASRVAPKQVELPPATIKASPSAPSSRGRKAR